MESEALRTEYVTGTISWDTRRGYSSTAIRFSIDGTEFGNIGLPKEPAYPADNSEWRRMYNGFCRAIEDKLLVTAEITQTKSKGHGGWNYHPPAWRMVTLVIEGEQVWPQ